MPNSGGGSVGNFLGGTAAVAGIGALGIGAAVRAAPAIAGAAVKDGTRSTTAPAITAARHIPPIRTRRGWGLG